MRLTSKGSYAVTAMLDLALNSKEKRPVHLARISDRQGIYLLYLEQLFARLRKHGFVTSVLGPGGGYLPGKDIGKIYVGSLITDVNDSVDAIRCQGKKSCQGGKCCLTHALLCALSDRISKFLNNITLEELVNNKEILIVENCHKNNTFHIDKRSSAQDVNFNPRAIKPQYFSV